jgi:hypothetical protein
MKKVLLLIIFVVLAGAVYFLRSSRLPADVGKAPNAQTDDKSRTFNRSTARSELPDTPSANDDIAQLKALLKAKNLEPIDAILAKMIQDLKDNPEKLNELLDAIKSELSPQLLPLLTRVIVESGSITNPLVAKVSLDVAKNDTVEARRHAALYLLGEVPEVSSEMRETVGAVSREARETLVRTSALATMADWMNDHPDMIPNLSGDIMQTVRSSDTLEVRANGLLFVSQHLNQLPESFTTEMIGFLNDPSQYNRATAARALATLPQKRAQVLSLLEQALSVERDLDTKRIMLGAIVRTGNTGSSELLNKFANDPTLADDVRDYRNIMAGGVTDWKEIYRLKEETDMARHPVALEKH